MIIFMKFTYCLQPRTPQTCENLLRPIARFALENGMCLEELQALMRQVALEEQRRAAHWHQRSAQVQSLLDHPAKHQA